MSCIFGPLFSVPAIALCLKRDKIKTTYTTNDLLLGHVIIELKAPVDISQITVTLSGLSISRKDGARHRQSHQARLGLFIGEKTPMLTLFQFLQRTQQVFPQHGHFDVNTSKSQMMGAKRYIFPFSLVVLLNFS